MICRVNAGAFRIYELFRGRSSKSERAGAPALTETETLCRICTAQWDLQCYRVDVENRDAHMAFPWARVLREAMGLALSQTRSLQMSNQER